MVIEEELNEPVLQSSSTPQREAHEMTSNGSSHQRDDVKNRDYFIAKVRKNRSRFLSSLSFLSLPYFLRFLTCFPSQGFTLV